MLGRSALLATTNSGELPGFGTRYANPSIRPEDTSFDVKFSNKGDAVAVAHKGSPRLSVYPWTYDQGFGTRFASPSPLPPGFGLCVDFHPDDSALGVGGEMVSPFSPRVYQWTASGFGSQYTSASGATDYQNDFCFSPSGTRVGLGEGRIFSWSSAGGFGAQYVRPASLLGNDKYVAFSPSEKAVIFGRYIEFSGNSPPAGSTLLEAYALSPSSSDFGARYSNPSDLGVPTANGSIYPEKVAFHPLGNVVFLCIGSTEPRLLAYRWSDTSGFGTRYANPSQPPNYGQYVAISPSGKYLATCGSGDSSGTVTPVSVYEWSYASGFGNRIYQPDTVFISPGSSNLCTSVNFSPLNNAIATCYFRGDTTADARSHVYAYKWNDPDPGDIYQSKVALLARFDGAAVDVSQNAIALTLVGNASISPQGMFGSGSLSCPANSGVTSGLSDMLRLGKNFTVECWVNPTLSGGNDGLFTFGTSTGWSGLSCAYYAGQWIISTTGVGGQSCGAAITGWQHIAVMRLNGFIYLFVNGVYKGGFSSSSDLSGSNRIGIGFYYDTSYSIRGLVDEFRVTNFVARYPVTGFTPPTGQFTYG